ncbi:ABC-2 type transport system ATP-binding protein [Virgibacillus natechei]|uniref:ABC-2 type transport system ATP-binding protein n=1 Tax=Virgibacillus natechei TaxID=1216297 RepID=A0ABS4IK53_9BACI|nr:ABC transporter ATP-binding protein [Virgibacillus natechei]MBP1971335.1 ABC-2 type transport system ATP-binding protein [Virgibacillus natechei]UZD12930.1 ABC transporter ATP-binding protein [Virgibacillus natechei]
MTVLELKDITKRFGHSVALDGVNLELNQGEVLGFIGPNGAGKSTTIRIILGLLRKTGGEAKLFGKDPWENAVDLHKRLAYVPGDVNLWPNLTGGEVIDLFGNLRGSMNTKRRSELIERFDLDPRKKCRTYSKGNRQKVALISAFASDVDLFILDEPTSGLDPLMEMAFQDCVAEAKAAGKTVLLSSHILSEVERLCDRVSIIKKGKVVETSTLGELRHLTRITVTVETGREIVGLEDLQRVFDVSVAGKKAQFQVDNQNLDYVLRHLLQFEIKTLTSTPPSLEDLFMRHYDNTQPSDRG